MCWCITPNLSSEFCGKKNQILISFSKYYTKMTMFKVYSVANFWSYLKSSTIFGTMNNITKMLLQFFCGILPQIMNSYRFCFTFLIFLQVNAGIAIDIMTVTQHILTRNHRESTQNLHSIGIFVLYICICSLVLHVYISLWIFIFWIYVMKYTFSSHNQKIWKYTLLMTLMKKSGP